MIGPRIYLETTIPSYLVSRASRDPILRGQQAATRKWWHANRADGQWFVSVFVEMEASRGHPEAAAKRLEAIDGLPRLARGPQVLALSTAILDSGLIPAKAATDASHIAIAAIHQMDILLTWNCTHIHNVAITRRIETICARAGHVCPLICTPFDLLAP